MSQHNHQAHRREDFLINMMPHALIWVMLAAACVLLAGFVSVLEDMSQRGEQRRLQQRTTGSVLLVDERKVLDPVDTGVLTAVRSAHALR